MYKRQSYYSPYLNLYNISHRIIISIMKLRTPFTFFHIYSIENYFNLRVLPNCISYSTNPHFQTIRRYPRPPICGNLSISPSAKTQLHFLLKIPKIRLESSFPHEKHGGFHMHRMPKLIHASPPNQFIPLLPQEPVSYTHLDVYKRQG